MLVVGCHAERIIGIRVLKMFCLGYAALLAGWCFLDAIGQQPQRRSCGGCRLGYCQHHRLFNANLEFSDVVHIVGTDDVFHGPFFALVVDDHGTVGILKRSK